MKICVFTLKYAPIFSILGLTEGFWTLVEVFAADRMKSPAADHKASK